MEKNCDYCKKLTSVKPCEIGKYKNHFCGRKCANLFKIGRRFPLETYPNYGNRGREFSKEWKKNMGDSVRRRGKDWKIKLSNSHRGVKRPEEIGKKISNSLMGHKVSKEIREKLSRDRKGVSYEEKYGKERTLEIKEKMREKLRLRKRKPLTPQSKEKMSLAYEKNREKHLLIRSKQILPLKDTSIEIKIQRLLKTLGIEFYTHSWIGIKYAYRCDIYIPSIKTIIECDGDYWHGNPKLNGNFMKFSRKIREQRIKDFERTSQLEEKGYKVIRLWGSEIRTINVEVLKDKLSKTLIQ